MQNASYYRTLFILLGLGFALSGQTCYEAEIDPPCGDPTQAVFEKHDFTNGKLLYGNAAGWAEIMLTSERTVQEICVENHVKGGISLEARLEGGNLELADIRVLVDYGPAWQGGMNYKLDMRGVWDQEWIALDFGLRDQYPNDVPGQARPAIILRFPYDGLVTEATLREVVDKILLNVKFTFDFRVPRVS